MIQPILHVGLKVHPRTVLSKPMRPGSIIRKVVAYDDDRFCAQTGSQVDRLIAAVAAAADATRTVIVAFYSRIVESSDIAKFGDLERCFQPVEVRDAAVKIPPSLIRSMEDVGKPARIDVVVYRYDADLILRPSNADLANLP